LGIEIAKKIMNYNYGIIYDQIMESNVNNVQKFSHFRDNLQRLLISSTDGYIDDKNMVEYLATLAAVVESQKPFLKKKIQQ
jgi:hypothetical protein